MSNSTSSTSTRGVRYTDAQKKEVLDFVSNYNAENGRGGQSKAADKFNISNLTIAGWLKGTKISRSKKNKGEKAPKVAKAAKSSKTGRATPGTRYTPDQKQEVVDFAVAYNEANGRGGQSKAAAKFNISPLTVMAWLKAAGVKKVKKGASRTAKFARPSRVPKYARASRKATRRSSSSSSGGNLDSKLSELLSLSKEIAQVEAELEKLNVQFAELKASL